ncbi:TPA: protein CapI, partial [Escherichia coli]
NIGNGQPVKLMEYIQALEDSLGIEAKKNFMPMQPGDVYQTYADTNALFESTGYLPSVNVKEGVAEFVTWFKEFYQGE